MTTSDFKREIWKHYRRAGRTTLPWRHTRDPYAIFVSEVMLQQTQVARVEAYYGKFIEKFPDFHALACARTSDVLKMWQGLGYNRRALFLKRAAIIVVERYGGRLPRGREALESLPGIGKGTSGSLMAFAFNRPEIFIETNIRRVFIHFFFNGRSNVTDAELERYIRSSVDEKRAKEWYWALMDYGAAMSVPFDDKKNTLESVANPNRRSAHYKKQSSFVGSDRALRGKIIRSTLSVGRNKIDAKELFKKLNIPSTRFEMLVGALEKEGFIVRKGNYIFIKK